jgi:hypothetical protein
LFCVRYFAADKARRTYIHLAAGRALNELVRPEFAPVLVHVCTQPLMKGAELSHCDLARNFRMGFNGRVIELRAQNIADCVALEAAADGARIPMDVL